MADVTDGESTDRGVSTPLKVVFAGGALTLTEAVYYIVNAELYAGPVDGTDLSATAVIAMNVIGLAFAMAAMWYAATVRHAPRKRSYLYVTVLGFVSLVTGILLANFVTVAGAVWGYLSLRSRPE